MSDLIRRWRWAILMVALLIAGLAWSFWPEARAVDLGRVSRGAMSVGVTDDGVTRAEDVFTVSAPVSGYASRIELEAGDRVERGQVITRMTGRPSTPLDPRSRAELANALAAARGSESAAAATLAQARRDLARAEELAQRGFLARARLEAARTSVATGAAALAQARAERARVAALLAPVAGAANGAPVPVRAPTSGSVLTVLNESEGVIAEGTPLMTIGDPAAIEVVIDLLSREAVRVRSGDRAEITEWGGGVPLVGRVQRIEPFGRLKISALGIEEQRVNVIIAFDEGTARQAARLGHGYQVEATIVLWRKADALRVPIGALFRAPGGGWAVLAAENGRARQKAVKLGQINAEYGEVLSGLGADDKVILNPANDLADGARIRAR